MIYNTALNRFVKMIWHDNTDKFFQISCSKLLLQNKEFDQCFWISVNRCVTWSSCSTVNPDSVRIKRFRVQRFLSPSKFPRDTNSTCLFMDNTTFLQPFYTWGPKIVHMLVHKLENTMIVVDIAFSNFLCLRTGIGPKTDDWKPLGYKFSHKIVNRKR